ncbi:MAG: hypothetical protein GXO23_07090 [Crenarchaeota archaeon]|nr:hypothetical protein [Thermoproteota archaeon]
MKCELCIVDEKKAENRCVICGRYVCNEHFIPSLGICKACELTLCHICKRRLAVAVCAVCGRPICERDSVRRGLVRICALCLQQQRGELSVDPL